MELTRAVLRFAAGRPHVLLLEVPGGTATRLAAEVELRRRGWPAAASPAEADMVVLAGAVGARLTPMMGLLWRQVPKPRVFAHLDEAAIVPQVLDEARRRLATGGETWEAFAGEEQDGDQSHEGHHGGEHGGDSDHGDGDHEDTSTGGGDHGSDHEGGDEQSGGDDHGDGHGGRHNHGGGHGHDHGGMEMPGGLSMAGRGPDRDGLQLDQLHVPLGPLLPDWPAGLVVSTTLQGDVVQQVEVDVLREESVHEGFWDEPWRRAGSGQEVARGEGARRRVAGYLDSLARFLRVAGWPDSAVSAARSRDELLAGARAEQVTPRLQRLIRKLRRARTLRWLTDGLGVLSSVRAESAGFEGGVLRASRGDGDVTARWQTWLTEIERLLPQVDDTTALLTESVLLHDKSGADPRSLPALAVLPDLLEGAELAGVRLIVASLDPDVTALGGRAGAEVVGD